MLDKIKLILKAKFSNKSNLGEWYVKRLNICKTCPYNSSNIPKYKWNITMWKWYILNTFQDFCSICKCEIKAKASIKIEECGLIEIDKEPKWVSIYE